MSDAEDNPAPCDNDGAVSSREVCCDHGRQLDHLDTMLHQITRQLANVLARLGKGQP